MVRQAINYAINRSAIVQSIELGYAEPGIGPIPPAIQEAWNPNINLYRFNGNVTKARELLAAAGYASGIHLKLLTAPFTSNYLQVTQAVANDLKAAGIDVTIDQESFATAACILLQGNATWELAFHDWGGTGTLTACSIVCEFYHTSQIGYFKWNLQHIRDENLTSLLDELSVANESQVMSLANKIQQRILAQAYGAILYYPDILQGEAPSVQNYSVHPNPWYGFVVWKPVIGAETYLSSKSMYSSVLISDFDQVAGLFMTYQILFAIPSALLLAISKRRTSISIN